MTNIEVGKNSNGFFLYCIKIGTGYSSTKKRCSG